MIMTFNGIMEIICLLVAAYLAYHGDMAGAAYMAIMAVYFTIKDATNEE
jgi:hypothetical protein